MHTFLDSVLSLRRRIVFFFPFLRSVKGSALARPLITQSHTLLTHTTFSHGYAEFLNIPNLPVTAYMAATCMFTKLPALRNARLAQEPPTCRAGRGGVVASGQGQVHDGKDDPRPPTFPVVVFSHGLGGSRTMYSTVCGDLASHGLVVVALEHRDGSGARTYVNVPPGRDSPELSQDERGSVSTAAPEKPDAAVGERPERARSYTVDYLVPEDNAQDTSPHNAKGVDRALRGAQIEMRLAELEEAHAALRLIAAGDPDGRISTGNLRRRPNRGSSSRGLEGVDWADWRGRLRLGDRNATIMGHSFGGATAVQVLRLEGRFPWVGQGILLDPWGPATPEPGPAAAAQDGGSNTVAKPLLSIGSEAFMHWGANHERVREICGEAAAGGAPCWMLTVRGSTHLSQTDLAVLYPRWMSLLMKTLVHPLRGIQLTVTPSLEFLRLVLPRGAAGDDDDASRRWEAVGDGWLRRLCGAAVGVDVEHRPDERWIAARLRIRNELRLRLRRWWNGVLGRGKAQENVPRDGKGRPLFGLKTWGPGEEVWAHMCPTGAEMGKLLARANGK